MVSDVHVTNFLRTRMRPSLLSRPGAPASKCVAIPDLESVGVGGGGDGEDGGAEKSRVASMEL